MTVEVADKIPSHKYNQFHEILCAHGGRYLSTPTLIGDNVYVNYEIEDYTEMCRAWSTCITPIREINLEQRWIRLARKIKGHFKVMLRSFKLI